MVCRIEDLTMSRHPVAHTIDSLCVAIWLVCLALIETGQACARQSRGQIAESRRLRILDSDRVAGRSGDERLPHHAAPSARDAQASRVVWRSLGRALEPRIRGTAGLKTVEKRMAESGRLSKVNHPSLDQQAGRLDFYRQTR